MQYKAFMIKYAEIGTKGKNRYIFEDILVKNINRKIKNYGDFYIRKEQGRIFIEAKSDYDYEDVVGALTKVFGIVGICPIVVEEDTSFEAIKEKVIEYYTPMIDELTVDEDMRQHLILKLLEELPHFPMGQA